MAAKTFFLLLTAFFLHCGETEAVYGQTVSVGFKSGAELLAPFVTTPQTVNHPPFLAFDADMRRFTYGPIVELRLPWSLAIEVGALHNRLKYTSTLSEQLGRTVAETTATSWEIPMVLKRYVENFGPLRPFGDLGLSLRHVDGQTHVDEFGPSFQPVFSCCPIVISRTISPPDLTNKWSSALVLAGGVDIRAYSFHVSPELRYTRWSNETFRNLGTPGVPGPPTLTSEKNALQLLVGITFGL